MVNRRRSELMLLVSGWLVAVAICFAWIFEPDPVATPDLVPEVVAVDPMPSPKTPTVAPPEPQGLRPDAAKLHLLQAENVRLVEELRRRTGEAEQARAETQAYKNGLEKAVAELNRQGRSAPRAMPTSRPSAPRDYGNVYSWTEPRVTVQPHRITVKGHLSSTKETASDEALTIILERDGKVIDRVYEQARVPAKGRYDYHHEWDRSTQHDERWSARVEVQ